MPPTVTPAKALNQAASILERYGLKSHAALAKNRFSRAARPRQVVVLGEVKRGKSYLTNALIGHRGLVPVGPTVCTSAPIRVYASASPTDSTQARLHIGDKEQLVDVDKLADWVAFGGEYVAANPDELPSFVSLQVGDSPLDAVTVVDTPGVGGLDESAVRMALREAANAGVLVLAVDASTTITAPEMDVLNRVKNAGGEVVVAVTKIDKNLRRWREIVEENKVLLKRHTGRDFPVVGVSSLRALDGLELAATQPERAAVVTRNSGIETVRAEIEAALELGDRLPKISGLQVAHDGLDKVLESIDRDLEAYSTQPQETIDELESRREKLKEIKEHGQEWEHYLQRNLTMGRGQIMQRMDDEITALQERWDRHIQTHGLKVLRTRPQVFTSQIEGELTTLMENSIGEVMQLLRSETMRLFDDETVWSEVAKYAMEQIAPPEIASKAIGKRTDGIFDPSMVTMGVIGAGMLTAIIPFAPVAGAVWVGVNMGFRAVKAGRSNLKSWIRETSVTTRQTTNRMADAVIAAVRPELVLRYRAHVRDELTEISTQIDNVKAAARSDQTKREETRARLTKNRQIVLGSQKLLTDAVAQLRQA